MNIHFFFKGKLSREEASSALIASLLEQQADFRSFFFEELDPLLELQDLKNEPVKVETENEDNIDIRLSYQTQNGNITVIIENKIRAGALQIDQLKGYYEKEVKKKLSYRIITILLTPSQEIGKAEVDRLEKHLQNNDSVHRISWKKLSEYTEIIQPDDPDRILIKTAFEELSTIIENSRKRKYLLEGGREIINDIAQKVTKNISAEFPNIKLWPDKDYFDIYMTGTNIGIDMLFVFKVEDKEPYKPIGIVDNQHLSLTFRTFFGLTARGKKNMEMRNLWKEKFSGQNRFDILPNAPHLPDGNRFKSEISLAGCSDEIVYQTTINCIALIKYFRNLDLL